MATRSGLTAPMLERQLVQARDEISRLKRDLEAARTGAVQIPVVTPGQLTEIRAAAVRLEDAAAAARSLSDSVTSWANQVARIADPQSTAPEDPPTA